ncbi:MAG TPA: tetratricopeptide repeat protein [Candidatus Angelobacter sp.]|jgi:Tfp pilus assembly protein PilF|nr:tetratricopeptide repeat protein [Candidatus Angelobacter sp.]
MDLGSTKLSACLLLGLALLSQAALAQRGSAASNRSGTPSRTSGPDPSAQPVFISGKVMLEGGGTLAEPVAIERVCNGTIHREGYSDSKGQFGFQLGMNVSFQDASESDARTAANSQPRSASNSGRTPINLTGCEFRAVLAGYQSTTTALRTVGETSQFDIGTIVLKRLGDAKGTTISMTSMSAPKDAMRAYEKAEKEMSAKPDEAEKGLSKAVKIYPQFAAAWTLLGDLHRQRNEFDTARADYAQAMAADPQFVNPTYGMAMVAMQEKKWDEAIQLTDQVVKLNAFAFPLAYFFNAAANYNAQKFDAAEDSAKKFKALDTQRTRPDVCILLSHVYSRKEDYVDAAREIRDYLAAAPDSPEAENLKLEAKHYEDLSIAKRD